MKFRSRNRDYFARPRVYTGGFRFTGATPVAEAKCPHCGERLFSNSQRIHDPLNCAMNK